MGAVIYNKSLYPCVNRLNTKTEIY